MWNSLDAFLTHWCNFFPVPLTLDRSYRAKHELIAFQWQIPSFCCCAFKSNVWRSHPESIKSSVSTAEWLKLAGYHLVPFPGRAIYSWLPRTVFRCLFNNSQGLRLYNLPEHPVRLVTLAAKIVFPGVQTEPPVFWCVFAVSGPVPGCHWKEPGLL